MRRWIAFRLVKIAFKVAPEIIYPLGQAILTQQERDAILVSRGHDRHGVFELRRDNSRFAFFSDVDD